MTILGLGFPLHMPHQCSLNLGEESSILGTWKCSDQKYPAYVVYKRDEILPSYMGIIS